MPQTLEQELTAQPKRNDRIKAGSPLPPRAVMLEGLRELGRRLGRTPTKEDWRRHYRELRMRSPEVYTRHFGSWTEAIRQAGLPAIVKQTFTRRELIDQLQNLSRELGRSLLPRDIAEAKRKHHCANVRTFALKFGSVPKALKEAGVYQSRKTPRKQLIKDLQKLAASIKHPLRISDITAANRRGECASISVYRKNFRTLPRAMAAAGLEYIPPALSADELILYLQQFHREHGRAPRSGDVDTQAKLGLMPHLRNFYKHFGSFPDALRAAGLVEPPEIIREEMLAKLRELTEAWGHAPVFSEWNEATRQGLIESPAKYLKVFGSVREARRQAGVLDRLHFSHRSGNSVTPAPRRGAIIDHLRKLADQLGRAPRNSEIQAAFLAGSNIRPGAIVRKFGSLKKAHAAAGLEPPPQHPKKFTPDHLLDQLREFARIHGETPTSVVWNSLRDLDATVNAQTIADTFGGWVDALRSAGLVPPVATGRKPKYDDDALLEYLRGLTRELGHPPSEREVRKAREQNGGPSASLFHNRFGGHRKALTRAGLGIPRRRPRTLPKKK